MKIRMMNTDRVKYAMARDTPSDFKMVIPIGTVEDMSFGNVMGLFMHFGATWIKRMRDKYDVDDFQRDMNWKIHFDLYWDDHNYKYILEAMVLPRSNLLMSSGRIFA